MSLMGLKSRCCGAVSLPEAAGECDVLAFQVMNPSAFLGLWFFFPIFTVIHSSSDSIVMSPVSYTGPPATLLQEPLWLHWAHQESKIISTSQNSEFRHFCKVLRAMESKLFMDSGDEESLGGICQPTTMWSADFILFWISWFSWMWESVLQTNLGIFSHCYCEHFFLHLFFLSFATRISPMCGNT